MATIKDNRLIVSTFDFNKLIKPSSDNNNGKEQYAFIYMLLE